VIGKGHYANQATLNTASCWHKFGTDRVPNIAKQCTTLISSARRNVESGNSVAQIPAFKRRNQQFSLEKRWFSLAFSGN
jgi:hypothetical protein